MADRLRNLHCMHKMNRILAVHMTTQLVEKVTVLYEVLLSFRVLQGKGAYRSLTSDTKPTYKKVGET
jgi:hypothetical protein